MRILVIEDNVDHQKIVGLHLEKRLGADVTFADTGETALGLIDNTWFDSIILDYELPTMNGLEVLYEIQKRGVHTPVIMITGQGTEQVAVEAMKKGAFEYITKNSIIFRKDELIDLVKRAVEHGQSLSNLHDFQNRFQVFFDLSREIFFQLDEKHRWVFVNSACFNILGYTQKELLGNKIDRILQQRSIPETIRNLQKLWESRESIVRFENTALAKDGRTVHLSWTARSVQDSQFATSGIIGTIVDDSLQKKLIEDTKTDSLRRSQLDGTIVNMVSAGTLYLETRIEELLHLLEAWRGQQDRAQDDRLSINYSALHDPLRDLVEQGRLIRASIDLDTDHRLWREVSLRDLLLKTIKEINPEMKVRARTDLPVVTGNPALLRELIRILLVGSSGDADRPLEFKFIPPPAGQKLNCFTLVNPWLNLTREERKDLFIPFKVKGIGIKLALAKRIVESHGGKIWVQDHPGEGIQFNFTLPQSVA